MPRSRPSSMPYSPEGVVNRVERSRADPPGVPPLIFSDALATETDPLLGALKADNASDRSQLDAVEGFLQKLLQPRTLLAVLTTIIIPWIIFVFAVLAVMHAHHPDKYVRAVAVCAIAGVCLLGFHLSRQVKKFNQSLLFMFCAISVLTGSVAGGLAYCSGAIDYWAFDEHWQYTNVWPTELASAHRDASALVFAQGSAPDLLKSVGYTINGHTYCVAPIIMKVSNLGVPDIQYWAAGRDCCEGDGRFACDDAGIAGARAGLVLRNRTFEFYSAFITNEVDYYIEAAHRAKVKFNIVSTADQPIFVRWVWDPDAGRVDFWRRSKALALEIILGYLPVSILLGLFTPALRFKSMA